MDNPSPLRDIRVVEMTEALAGPYGGMMLGDLGADVIKVERPGTGDQSRAWGPPFVEGESAYFLSVNRNKRSIELDIKDSNDLNVLHKLLESADVFLTNNPRMSSLQRARLDPDTLAAMNAGLIYAAISGYGHTGPKANRSGYDIIAQGEAGLMALTGPPEAGPSRFPSPMADITGGIYATIGIVAALYARDNRNNGFGRGQFIDVALVDAQTTWLANLGGSYFATGEQPKRLGNAHPTVTPYQPIRARDKMMIIAVGNDRLWRRFGAILGIESTVMRDPRFDTNAKRNVNRDPLIALLEAILVKRDANDWIEAFLAEGIPAGPINFPDDTLTDEHILARGMIVELEHPLIGAVRSIALPAQLSETGPSYRRHPPRLGEHNEEIRALAASQCSATG
ncbi:CaiB/BaiF CoA transferase family protein [Candidatus Rariloculus sp.]|uniref:CaiB/BaiF CoA transferase family protein n=1 Tax=Candidatus Rariloculus sp. TaxID=3101265 RepID=UPI003D112E0C